jgi:hypothetical protein
MNANAGVPLAFDMCFFVATRQLDSAQITPACLHPPQRATRSARHTTCDTRLATHALRPRRAAGPSRRTRAFSVALVQQHFCSLPARSPSGGRAANMHCTAWSKRYALQTEQRAARPAHAVPVGRGMCPRAAAAQFDVHTSWSDPPRLALTSGQPSSRLHAILATELRADPPRGGMTRHASRRPACP